ncbi:MAG TPA: PAS domain S-box protein, partial [Terriglobales bacterium]|nr:PAS domain S-box protein [Terriglobales bacterium]
MHWLYPCVAAACILLPVLLCAVLLHHEYREQQEYWRERLSRTADLNQPLIHSWLQQRSADARLLASLVATSSVPPIESGNQNPLLAVPGRLLKTTLTSVAISHNYAGAYVLDYAGKVQTTSDGAFILPAAAATACRESSGQGFLTLPSSGGRAEYPRLAIITPVRPARASRGSSGGVTQACVVLLLRSAAFHQLRLAGREASSTGETLLVVLQENQPLFISPLRNWTSGTAPAVGAPGRMAVLQHREGLGEYRDYRGTPVLAATRFIQGVDWGLITKVDRSEVFFGFNHILVLGLAITLLLVVLLLSLANGLWTRWRRQRYREALLNASIGLALTKPDGCFLNVNRCFCKIIGYSEQELRGRDSLSLIHPDDRERDLAMSQRMAAGEASSSSIEERYRCKDGSTVWVKKTISPVRNRRGRITSTILLLEDITERRLAEITRQESEQRFRQLSEAAFEAIAI